MTSTSRAAPGVEGAVRGDGVLGDDGVPVAAGVVDVRKRLRGMEREPEQSLLVAVGDAAADVQHGGPPPPARRARGR